MIGKRLLVIALATLLLISSFDFAFADTFLTMVLTVPELTADNALQAVEALEGIDGVEKAEADPDNTTVKVTYVKYEADLYNFRRALEAIGLTITNAVDTY